jgi:ribonucleoside-triphosphate reductase
MAKVGLGRKKTKKVSVPETKRTARVAEPKKPVSANAFKTITKRDGRKVRFEEKKIVSAVEKAFAATGEGDGPEAKRVVTKVLSLLKKDFRKGGMPSVEDVQDMVERVLMILDFEATAKAYIIYREEHARLREMEDALALSSDLVDQYLRELDWRVKENANMAYSLQGLNNYIASIVSANYWMNKVYPKEIREAHEGGDFHIHDLQIVSAYCCGWDLQDLIRRGFTGVPGKISSKPPKHFGALLGQMVNFIYTLQGEVAGAQAFSNFDTLLAPFVRYDKLTYRQVKQEMQTFVFNMNVSTRVGFQTPFSNITMDITCPKALAKESVVIGGVPQKESYGEFQKEMDMINQAFAEVMMEGDADSRVFTFPIPTYNIGKDFNWDDDRYEPIWEMTAKYGIPYFANFVNSDMDPEDARSMCPLAGTEKVLVRSSRGRVAEYSMIRNIFEGNSKQDTYEVYSDGKFVSGRFSRFRAQKMLQVRLENGHEIKMTIRHLNFIRRGEAADEEVIEGSEIVPGMYLPYSLKTYQGEGGTEDFGFFVGAYAGDGSYDGDGTVVFSLEDEKKKYLIRKLEKIALDSFGAHCTVTPDKKTKLVTLKVHSKAAVGLCRDYVEGIAREKRYRARIFTASKEFRTGVLEGHYATDGGNRHRIYTSSIRMVETINMLAATLGTTTSVYKDDREGRFGTESNYAVLVYQLNRERYGKLWFKKEGKLWVRIESVEPINNSTAYCFEVAKGEPVFTVGTTGILTHNCRLRLDNRELHKRGGGLFGAAPLTGSIGVVTINLPRIGYVAETEAEFFTKLDLLMDVAKESLEIKRKLVEKLTDQGLYPYTKFYLAPIKQRRGEYWANHFSTIGLYGMNEAALNLIGTDITTKRGQKFAEKVLSHMRKRIIGYQKETGNLYNLEATPAEGIAGRLPKMDKQRYPDIICANEEEVRTKGAYPYYTNSSQLPVGYTDDIFEALELQDNLQTKYTGGTVLHGFLGERMWDSEATKQLVRKIAENYKLPYFTLTPTFSICPTHGYVAGEHFTCPQCIAESSQKEYSKVS